MRILNRIMLVLHIFVGIGGMAGGLAAITNPQNPLGVSADIMKNSPFTTFFIPGIILFAVIGLGNIASAVTLLLKSKYQGYISSVFSWALVIWIVVQCIMLKTIAALHIVFFIYGMIQAVLAAVVLFRQHLFPANIVINIYKKMTKTS